MVPLVSVMTNQKIQISVGHYSFCGTIGHHEVSVVPDGVHKIIEKVHFMGIDIMGITEL